MMTLFRDQKFENFRERGTTQSRSGIKEGPLSAQHTRVFRFDRLWRSTPSAVFEQFEHCLYKSTSKVTFDLASAEQRRSDPT